MDRPRKLRERKRRFRHRPGLRWWNAQNQTSEGYLTVLWLPEMTALFLQMGIFPMVSRAWTSDRLHGDVLKRRARTGAVKQLKEV